MTQLIIISVPTALNPYRLRRTRRTFFAIRHEIFSQL